VAAEPSPLPELKPVAVEVDVAGVPASEQAALVPLVRASRQMDANRPLKTLPRRRSSMR
jgi:hypothetical protein